MTTLTIGRLASATGCKVSTIRYYEQVGLLPKPARSAGNTRIYEQIHLERLGFIQHCRQLGFAQSNIRDMLELSDHPDQSCEAVTAIARSHLEDLDRRIARMSALRNELKSMIDTCSGGRVEQCRIVKALVDYGGEVGADV